jgi:hypothetical protein
MEIVPFEACGARCIWGEDCTGHPAHLVVVPEPYQAGVDGRSVTLPSEKKIGEGGFRTRQRTLHRGVRTW